MAVNKYDVVVIGAGPAGEAAAMKAAKMGNKVLVVERRSVVGGNCTHLGTIPSKALRNSVRHIIRYNTDPMFRDIGEPRWFSFPKIVSRINRVIDSQIEMRTTLYARNQIELMFGQAKFIDKNTIEVEIESGLVEIVEFQNAVIAVGSRPYWPDDVDFSHPRVFDVDTILKLDFTPKKLIIFGAAVIGCEYASIFCGLGIKVDLIDTQPQLLHFLDDEISDALSYHLRDQGVLIYHNEEFDCVETFDDGVIVNLKSGKKLKGDALLWSHGRVGNTDTLNLDKIGLEATERGQLKVNNAYQTSLDHIYAAGDVIGWPGLASAAYDQGRFAAAVFTNDTRQHFVEEVPTGIYTIPEISSIGKTGKELTEAKIPYEVGQAFFKTLARAQIANETVGMLKIYFHRETLEILGVHCFGYQAAEIVHIGQAIMEQEEDGNTLEYFIQTTFNYPTIAEDYRVAALDGLNRIF